MWSFRKEIHKLSVTKKDPVIPCGGFISISNSTEGVFLIDLNIGTDTGVVELGYNAQNIPDRFQIIWDGNVVADSKYVGNGISGNPPDYNNSLVGETFNNIPEYLYTGPGPTDYNLTGTNYNITVNQSDVANGSTSEPTSGSGNISFAKTTAQPSTMRVVVYGVLGGTLFSITPNCPTTPTTKLEQIGFGIKADSACEDFYLSPNDYFILNTQNFSNATVIYTDSGATTFPIRGFYSNGFLARFWDGTQFLNNQVAACSVEAFEAGYSTTSGADSCNNFNNSPIIAYRDVDTDFATASNLFQTNNQGMLAPAGFYSDGSVWKEWDGTAFTTSGNC